MSSCNATTWLLIGLICCSGAVQASSGYVVGINGIADNAGGRAVSGFIDYGITESTWVSGTLAHTNTGGPLGGLDTIYVDAAFEQSFGLTGFRAGAAYWGDDDILDSNDFRASLFFRGEKGSLSLDYERREFDFVYSPLLEPDRILTTEFSANGIGVAASLKASDRSRLFVSGMSYDYSRDIRLQPRFDALRFLSTSRLSLMNSLIDYRISGGMEFQFGHRAVDLTLSHWQTAIDGGKVSSVSIGFITPSGPASDLEYRLAFDDSENFGNTFAFAVSFYFFGT